MAALKPARGRKPAPKNPRRKGLPKGARAALRWGAWGLGLSALIGGGTWIYMGGHGAKAVAAVGDGAIAASAHIGLSVQNVLVLGRNRADRDDVSRALGAHRGMAILAFDPHAAKARLEKLSWVRAAVVERRLPDTIYLRLVEREPLALWQTGGSLALIDREGVVITRRHLDRYAKLPLVVGTGANEQAEAILDILRAAPAVTEATAAIVRVAERRWDLKLKGGVMVHLPEDAAARAVARLDQLIAREGILARDIVAIDMRLPDRLVVRAKPGAAPQSGADASKGSKSRVPVGAPKRPSKDT